MYTMEYFFLIKLIGKLNFLSLILSLLLGYIVFYGAKLLNLQNFNASSVTPYVKSGVTAALMGSFSAHLLCF